MSHYKPYPAYRNSGVEWIGQVPEHWEVKRLEYVVTTHRESVASHDLASLEVLHYSIPAVQETGGGVVEDGAAIDSNKLVVRCPQVLISKLNPRKNTVVIADADPDRLTVASTEFVPLLPQSGRSTLGFIASLVTSAHLRQLLESRVESVTRSHQRVLPEDITKAILAIPPIDEQTYITAQLDRETTRIDALIAKKTRFIELLKEKRQALITHAVTKGLDPNVKMKDSGVEWLGEVPEHWKVTAIKRLSPVCRGASPRPIDDPKYFDDEGQYGWVRISDVSASDGYLYQTEQKLSDLGSSLSVKLPIESLFLSIAGSVGKPCISKIDACIHDGFVYFPFLKIDPMWLFRVFETKRPFVGLGKLGTQLNLNTETVGGIYIGLPPMVEIESILAEITTQTARIESLVSKTQRSIDLLKERRAAFITAAVTGQIDLRESA